MKDCVISFILAGGEGRQLSPLTAEYPTALIPFGGLFRIIDFSISNLLQAQFRQIYVLTGYKPERVHAYIGQSLMQHARDFRFDLDEGIRCLPAEKDLSQILPIVAQSNAEHVAVVSGEQIYRMDYARLLRQHISTRADVTTAIGGVYLFRREIIMRQRHLALSEIRNASTFNFNGYYRSVATLDDYHAANMDFLTERPGFDPYAMASKLLQTMRSATNSRIALGARVGVCKITNSVISDGARVDNGAEVENSVLLPGAHIQTGARVHNAIVAPGAIVSPLDQKQYDVTPEGVVVITANEGARHFFVKRRCARVATRL